MAFQFRKLLLDSHNETFADPSDHCDRFCDLSKTSSGCCQPPCLTFCSWNCPSQLPPPPPPPPISSSHHPNNLLIAGLTVLASVFVIVCCCAIYVKFYLKRRTRSVEQRNEIQEDFLDEDHGPVIDHPIWYIRTAGLQQSVISSITVCKYKKADGLVEGTDCSVCLNEFQEDETLRLLPKCSHAFHIPCIDTWLRSHTNCPMCRAPILTNPPRESSSEVNSVNTSAGEETQIGILANHGESNREIEGGESELRNGTELEGELQGEDGGDRCENLNTEEDAIQPVRRSVSLDSLSAMKISQALANVRPMESDQNLQIRSVKENGIVPKRVGGNHCLLKFMATSSFGRSLQIGPSSLKRSFSCGGKLFFSRNT